MIEHHLQKDILNQLVRSPSARFAELKPKAVDGNIFTYHLQQLIKHDFVTKQSDGSYCLTPLGKATGITSKLSESAVARQAHSILLLAVRDEAGRWLLRRRLVHPMHGKIGFIHSEPEATESITMTAARALERRTALQADFEHVGDGYIRIFKDGALESFTHFSLLQTTITGDTGITPGDETGENAWYDKPDFTDSRFIPSMSDIVKMLASDEKLLCELEYYI